MNPSASIALVAALAAAGPAQSPAPAKPAAEALRSTVVDWQTMVPVPTQTGERRAVLDAPTATLDRLHAHVTVLNPGQDTGPLHRHPQEELVIVREGTLEVNIDGRKQIAGPGSLIFFAVNENENMTNVGKTPATYAVVQWFTPRTPTR
jgi:quercetin dioxygenase-like cupin family protein